MLSRHKIAIKLPVLVVTSVVASVAAVGLVAYMNGSAELRTATRQELPAVAAHRAMAQSLDVFKTNALERREMMSRQEAEAARKTAEADWVRAATEEITRNVQQAAQGAQEVARKVQGLREGAQSSSAGAEQVLTSAGLPAQQANELRTAVDTHVRDIAA